ncbi:tetratricopeptide repeat protein [Alkalihalobacillus sp. CinArs1]|uniref:tetratricopeptide repeat protein n=1 Tax=Alkalihalobacillus sp. CinArs1 TaxID=2995314 RepID=UPI0022DE2758|nr:tetratricopeptide repeat protein [Alkalihalobacillus sp. CinArs1]
MERLKQAISLIEAGNFEEGLKELTKVRETADHEGLYDLSNIYYNLGLIEDARDVVEELLMHYPNEGELLVQAAECYVELEQEQEAIAALSKIDENDAAYPPALLLLADLYQTEGLEEVAEQKLLEAKRISPDEPIIDFGLGEFYLTQGHHLKAVPYYEAVINTKSELANENIELRLAEALSGSGQFEEALTYYEKGLENAREINALFGYGFTAIQINEYKKAIHAFKELKDLDPQYSTLYPYLAKAYEEEGAVTEAIETLAQGIKVDEFNEELYLQASRLSFKSHDEESGERYLRELLAINPSHIEAAKTLATFFRTEERYDDILDLLQNIEEGEQSDPYLDWSAATALQHEEKYKEAINRYENAYTYFKNDPLFLEEYGLFLIEEGRRKEAIELFKHALKQDPTLTHLEEDIMRFEEERIEED